MWSINDNILFSLHQYVLHILTGIMATPQTVVHVDTETVQTNIVFLTVTKPGLTATQLYQRLLQVTIERLRKFSPFNARQMYHIHVFHF